jgi:hypothetical protein
MYKKLPWVRVTNEFVAKFFGQKGCTNCDGNGFIGGDAQGRTVCSCATLAFRREMIATGKVRRRCQRIGNKDVIWLEYRELGSVTEELEK